MRGVGGGCILPVSVRRGDVREEAGISSRAPAYPPLRDSGPGPLLPRGSSLLCLLNEHGAPILEGCGVDGLTQPCKHLSSVTVGSSAFVPIFLHSPLLWLA